MKTTRKILAIVMVIAMIMSMGVLSAFAAETGTITIKHAGIGETYSIYKVLDAEVGVDGAIIYNGTIPEGLTDYFEENASGEISKVESVSESQLFAALQSWAKGQNADKSVVANASEVVFDGVDFGYYVVTSTMNDGAVISVTSTNPNAVTYEKNVTTPQPTKTVEDEDYSIGDEIPYTVTFNGANYMKAENADDDAAQIVTSYTVSDTLPAFLSGAKVTSITIGEGDSAVTLDNINFDNNKSFNIPWATYNATTKEWTSNYPNGTLVTIKYTATLTNVVRVGEDNTNTVTIKANVADGDGGDEKGWDETWSEDAVITTYATAIKKVDGKTGKTLAGAKFKVQGLTVTETAAGVYTVVKYDPAKITLADSTEMVVNEDGMLYIVGLDEDLTLSLTETEAPAGYNKLTAAEEITSQKVSEEIYKLDGYRKYDAKGNIIEESVNEITDGEVVVKNLSDLDENAIEIENNAGTTLPSTGGMGTALLIGAGSVLALAAALFLVTKKRVKNAEV